MLFINRATQLIPIKLTIVALLGITSNALIGCQQLTKMGLPVLGEEIAPTAIAQLKQKKNGTKVYLQGKVIQKAPFLGSGAYQLQDETGKIWIWSANYLPQPGEEIVLQGQVQYQSFFIAQHELGEFYIVELKQLET